MCGQRSVMAVQAVVMTIEPVPVRGQRTEHVLRTRTKVRRPAAAQDPATAR